MSRSGFPPLSPDDPMPLSAGESHEVRHKPPRKPSWVPIIVLGTVIVSICCGFGKRMQEIYGENPQELTETSNSNQNP